MNRPNMLLNFEYTVDKSGPVALSVFLAPSFNTICYPLPSSLHRVLPVPLIITQQPLYPVSLQGGSAQLAERWASLKTGELGAFPTGSISSRYINRKSIRYIIKIFFSLSIR